MGGDDIDGDDFLLDEVTRSELTKDDKTFSVSNDDVTIKKRKLVDESHSDARKKSPDQILLDFGKSIELQGIHEQVTFLNTIIRHNLLLANKETSVPELKKEYLMLAKGNTFSEKIKYCVSLKKIKDWKITTSPCIVIVTASARRAVAILKEIADLEVRAIKLFPKSGDVGAQLAQLAKTPYGIAIGTPHRLLKLCEEKGQNSLSFDSTRLMVVDANVSNKDYTVCTLPDCASPFTELLASYILPSTAKNKQLRVAFI